MDFLSVEPPLQQCTVWFCWDKMTTVWLSSGINTIFHTHHCTFKTSSPFLYFLDQLLDPYFDICSGLYPLNIDSLPHTEFSGMTTCVKGFLAVHSYPFECWDCFRQTKEIGLLRAVLHCIDNLVSKTAILTPHILMTPRPIPQHGTSIQLYYKQTYVTHSCK